MINVWVCMHACEYDVAVGVSVCVCVCGVRACLCARVCADVWGLMWV